MNGLVGVETSVRMALFIAMIYGFDATSSFEVGVRRVAVVLKVIVPFSLHLLSSKNHGKGNSFYDGA